jgi:hypothetical protein
LRVPTSNERQEGTATREQIDFLVYELRELANSINDALSDVMNDEIDRLVAAPPERIKTMRDVTRKIDTLELGVLTIK